MASLLIGAGGGLIFYRRFQKRRLKAKEDMT
ncbi:MAG: hypothetical protein V3V05_03320 [Pontiella sp.]